MDQNGIVKKITPIKEATDVGHDISLLFRKILPM